MRLGLISCALRRRRSSLLVSTTQPCNFLFGGDSRSPESAVARLAPADRPTTCSSSRPASPKRVPVRASTQLARDSWSRRQSVDCCGIVPRWATERLFDRRRRRRGFGRPNPPTVVTLALASSEWGDGSPSNGPFAFLRFTRFPHSRLNPISNMVRTATLSNARDPSLTRTLPPPPHLPAPCRPRSVPGPRPL